MKKLKILNMNIYITKDYDTMSKKAADLLASVINQTERPVLGLATGGTTVGMYTELIQMNKAGQVDFSKTTTFNLDEYYPISESNHQSYHYFMKENLFNHINIDVNNTYIPDGMAKDSEEECEAFDKKMRATGGVHMQVLGIGTNGHIGFNEPADHFPIKTHKEVLTKGTIQDNSRFFDNIEDMPTEALTIGIGTLMDAKKIMLLASGKGKAEIIKQTLLGKVTPRVPASILQFHKDVTVILDEEAASELFK